MDNILLCTNHIPLVTSIHNTFIEKYMLGANGSYVKVYLYLSKCIQAGESDLSISSLADRMECTEKDIVRAFSYWEKKHLLRISRGEDKSVILGIEILNPDDSAAIAALATTAKGTPRRRSTDRPLAAEETATLDSASASEISAGTTQTSTDHGQHSTDTIEASTEAIPNNIEGTDTQIPVPGTAPETIAVVDVPSHKSPSKEASISVSKVQMKKLAQDTAFVWISNVVESYLGHPLKPGELQLLSYLYDNLHFSTELILYLYEYCISIGKTSVSYIQAVAISWDEKHVTTPEEATAACASHNASFNEVSRSFALGRQLATAEKQYVRRWCEDWQMDLSVILEACNRTMLKVQKADFKYCQGILDNWHKANIHTLMDVEKADELFARKKAAQKAATANHAAPGSKKFSYASYEQRGLSANAASDLEKKLLHVK